MTLEYATRTLGPAPCADALHHLGAKRRAEPVQLRTVRNAATTRSEDVLVSGDRSAVAFEELYGQPSRLVVVCWMMADCGMLPTDDDNGYLLDTLMFNRCQGRVTIIVGQAPWQ